MAQDLTNEVRLFYKHAEWCSRQAKGVVNTQVRKDFTRLAEKWLKLARSYEVARSLRSQNATSKQR
jgi:hypothetical protein